jgi:hypothetical protein
MRIYESNTGLKRDLLLRTCTCYMLVSCLAYSALKMEATCSSETSVDFQRTKRQKMQPFMKWHYFHHLWVQYLTVWLELLLNELRFLPESPCAVRTKDLATRMRGAKSWWWIVMTLLHIQNLSCRTQTTGPFKYRNTKLTKCRMDPNIRRYLIFPIIKLNISLSSEGCK